MLRSTERAPAFVSALADAGRTGSALRKRLKEAEIDPKLARLVLLLYRRDMSYCLSIRPCCSARSSQREFDRRGTWARLTRAGVVLRQQVEQVLETMPNNERPRGAAYGIRSTPGWDY